MREWRDVPGMKGLFSVSSDGLVRRDVAMRRWKAGELLKGADNGNGYRYVGMTKDGVVHRWAVHRLVCEVFHGPAPSSAHEVAHGDGVRSNNAASNLRWATRSENHADKAIHGTHSRGERAFGVKLTASDVLAIKNSCEMGRDLAVRYNVQQSQISRIRHGTRWAHLEAA